MVEKYAMNLTRCRGGNIHNSQLLTKCSWTYNQVGFRTVDCWLQCNQSYLNIVSDRVNKWQSLLCNENLIHTVEAGIVTAASLFVDFLLLSLIHQLFHLCQDPVSILLVHLYCTYLRQSPLVKEHSPPTSLLHPNFPVQSFQVLLSFYLSFSCLLLIHDVTCSSALRSYVSLQEFRWALAS